MVSLEQIRILEQKVTAAVALIRTLREENATLRRGLDSAQRRMQELETLVEGFRTDQREIESAIVRTLQNLDGLEESVAASAGSGTRAGAPAPSAVPRHAEPSTPKAPPAGAPAAAPPAEDRRPAGNELDIF